MPLTGGLAGTALRERFRAKWVKLRTPALWQLIRRVSNEGWTYLPDVALLDLIDAVRAVEAARVPGMIVEAGCALGGSAIVLAACKQDARPMCVYDSFEGMPPPTDRDGADVLARYEEITAGRSAGLQGKEYYGYEPNLRDLVINNFVACGITPAEKVVRFIPGWYETTLRPSEPIALAHIDCDWYDSVRTCLERLTPHLSSGGRLIIDDYEHYSGCRQAVDDFFEGARRAEYQFRLRSRLQITRL